jgi:predicted nucleic acid-binding protein
MPISDRGPDVLVDTSVAVALCAGDHVQHESTVAALRDRVLGLAGHAAFETFSVLTRLPPPSRRPPGVVARLMSTNFPASRFLSSEASPRLLAELSSGEIAGGSVFDALVGAAAREHGLPLATRDRRALDTYRVLGIEVEVLPDAGRPAMRS